MMHSIVPYSGHSNYDSEGCLILFIDLRHVYQDPVSCSSLALGSQPSHPILMNPSEGAPTKYPSQCYIQGNEFVGWFQSHQPRVRERKAIENPEGAENLSIRCAAVGHAHES